MIKINIRRRTFVFKIPADFRSRYKQFASVFQIGFNFSLFSWIKAIIMGGFVADKPNYHVIFIQRNFVQGNGVAGAGRHDQTVVFSQRIKIGFNKGMRRIMVTARRFGSRKAVYD